MLRLFALLAILSLVTQAPVAFAQSAPCQFVLGFATIAAMIPQQVGQCIDNEGHNPANGDALQHTTGGLLVWRKADNWTAFTDGYHTWVNGPNGLMERLNTQRFMWEANPEGLPIVGGSSSAPVTPAPSAILDVSGSGTKTTQAFVVPASWTMSWSYDCSAFGSRGNFIVFVDNSDGSPSNNAGTNQLGPGGHGTEYFHSGGNLYLQVISECSWHVTVHV